MHLDPVVIFFIVWGLSGILFRRWNGRQYVATREMWKRVGVTQWGSTTQRRGEILSIAIGVFLIIVGVLFSLVAS